MIITIDGLTATGKSSVARLLAGTLGIVHINSGLLFRALGYLLSTHYGYDTVRLQNPSEKDIAVCLDQRRFIYHYEFNTQQISLLYDKQDITSLLMTKESDVNASLVATNAQVQYNIIETVRAIGTQANSCVVDGRNAGSVIFPHAQIKILLVATLAIRAERWRKDRGIGLSHEEACAYINERDLRDIQRTVAPFVIPAHAYTIDTSFLLSHEVCKRILDYIESKQGDKN